MHEGWGPRTTKVKVIRKGGAGAYFLGFLGALVYFLQRAPTFWAGLLGILKALLWPAFLVYAVLRHVGA